MKRAAGAARAASSAAAATLLATALAALLATLVLVGCATVPPRHRGPWPGVRWGDYKRFDNADLALWQALPLVERATPESLAKAAAMTAAPGEASPRDAAALAWLGARVFGLLYPEMKSPFPAGVSETRPEGFFPGAFFDAVEPALALLDPRTLVDTARAAALSVQLAGADSRAPGSVLPPYLQGLLVQRTGGEPAAARARFEECLRRSPSFSPAAGRLLDIIIAGGSAAAELPRLEALAALLPTEPARAEALARAELAGGQPARAADAAAKGLLAAPDAPVFVLLRAKAFEALGDWYQALWLLDTLLKLAPDLPEASLMKARLLYDKQANSAGALRTLIDAEERYPSEPAFPELRGRVLLSTGRAEEGLAALARALELAPGRVTTLTLMAGQAVASAAWNRVAELVAKIPEPTRTAEHLRMGWLAASRLGDHAQALDYARALAAKQAGAEPFALQARSLLAAGRTVEGMDAVTRGLAVAGGAGGAGGAADAQAGPQGAESTEAGAALRATLLVLRSAAGSEDPLRDLRTALLANPDDVEALVAISDLLARAGEYRTALGYARRAAELSPRNASLAAKAADLARLADAGR
jgi:tetratricopeptide (TPR) repeat protein